ARRPGARGPAPLPGGTAASGPCEGDRARAFDDERGGLADAALARLRGRRGVVRRRRLRAAGASRRGRRALARGLDARPRGSRSAVSGSRRTWIAVGVLGGAIVLVNVALALVRHYTADP